MQREYPPLSCLFSLPKPVSNSHLPGAFPTRVKQEVPERRVLRARRNFWSQWDWEGCAQAVFGLGLPVPLGRSGRGAENKTGSGQPDCSLMKRAKHTISLLLGLLGLVVRSPENPGCLFILRDPWPWGMARVRGAEPLQVGSASCRSQLGTLCHMPSMFIGCFLPQCQLSSCQGALRGRKDWVGKWMVTCNPR